MAGKSMLLQGGVILEHQEDDRITSRQADILVEGGQIAKVEPFITPPADCEIIDCRNKLISPGMINTHSHTWQTQLKGRHSNQNLMSYMISGNFAGYFFTPRDIELGQLCGALENIDAGTTTIVDHDHGVDSEGHFHAAVQGLEKSGIRAVFCPAIAARAKSYEPEFTLKEPLPSWFMPLFEKYLEKKDLGDGRIVHGLGHDALLAFSKDEVVELISGLRAKGLQLFTFHQPGAIYHTDALTVLDQYDLLGPDILLSHGTNMTPEQISRVLETGVKVSCTPSTELHVGLGDCLTFHKDASKNCSLGIDCHSFTAASILNEARLGLAWERGIRNSQSLSSGQIPPDPSITMEDALNQATIQGARAIGMQDRIGSIAVGKRADLLIWDTLTPAMAPVARYNPIEALIMHSSPRDIDAVIIDGLFRKKNGRLLPAANPEGVLTEWAGLATELVDSFEAIEKKSGHIDYDKAKGEMLKAFSAGN